MYTQEYVHLYDQMWPFEDGAASVIHRLLGEPLTSERSAISILDAASGTGNPALRLAELGYSVICTDCSGAMLAKLDRKAQEKRLRIPTHVLHFAELPSAFAAHTFHAVTCMGAGIEHVTPIEQQRAVIGFSMLLAPGGTLVVDTHVFDQAGREMQRLDQGNVVLRGAKSYTVDTHTVPSTYTVEQEPLHGWGLKVTKTFHVPDALTRSHRLNESRVTIEMYSSGRDILATAMERAGLRVEIHLDAYYGLDVLVGRRPKAEIAMAD